MKIYSVVISATAKEDIRAGYGWAAKYAPETAARWLDRFYMALHALSTNPERCSVAPETEVMGREIRQFLFGKGRNIWRALFLIEQGQVCVLHVRRAARDTASREELADPEL